MAGKPSSQRDFNHTWFLREWMEQAGKKQAALFNELGWTKGRMSAVWHGQQYNQEIIDEVAPWLNVRPYELLMHPDEAMMIRRLRGVIADVVAPTAPPAPSGPPAPNPPAAVPLRRKAG